MNESESCAHDALFFVEEQSAEVALIELIPKILEGYDFNFDIFSFSGKSDLLKKLPSRLAGYRHLSPKDHKLIVLVDQDQTNCKQLKQQLEQIALNSGLTTWTMTHDLAQFHVLNRIAIEELEGWFFGDVEALHAAYPRVSIHLASQAPYRDPDRIRDTWEHLEKVLKEYHPGGLEKIRAAREIAQHMQPNRNRSRSFQVFRDTLRGILDAYA